MKKSILAVAIPALMAANSAFAFELLATDTATVGFYGELRARIYDEDKKDEDTKLEAYADSIGVSLDYNVAPGLDAVGLLEFGTDADATNSSKLNHKKAYAGFASETLGTVTFGKQNLPFDALGNAALGYDFDENAEFGSMDNNSSVDYEYLSDMLWVNAAYGFREKGTVDSHEVSQLAVGVTVAGLTVNAGYSDEGSDLDAWIVEAIYGIGDLTLAGQYTEQSQNDLDGNAYALAASYNYGPGYMFAGYETKDDDISGIDADYAYAGADYRFNEYARVFAEYGFEDPENDDSQNKFGVGLRLYW